jgi:hypothetical protein
MARERLGILFFSTAFRPAPRTPPPLVRWVPEGPNWLRLDLTGATDPLPHKSSWNSLSAAKMVPFAFGNVLSVVRLKYEASAETQ